VLHQQAGTKLKKVYNQGKIAKLSYQSRSDIQKLHKYMYQECSISMSRKQNRFMEHEAAEKLGLFAVLEQQSQT